MESNFSFIQNKWPILATLGSQAEIYLYSDPHASQMKLRVFAETITKYVIAEEKIAIRTSTQAERIRLLNESGIVPSEVESILDHLRRMANSAHHNYNDSVERAKLLLQLAYKLSVWFYSVYGDSTYEYVPFTLPQQALAENEVSARLEELEQLYEAQIAEMEQEITSLRKRNISSQEIKRRQQQSQLAAQSISIHEIEALIEKKLNSKEKKLTGSHLFSIATISCLLLIIIILVYNQQQQRNDQYAAQPQLAAIEAKTESSGDDIQPSASQAVNQHTSEPTASPTLPSASPSLTDSNEGIVENDNSAEQADNVLETNTASPAASSQEVITAVEPSSPSPASPTVTVKPIEPSLTSTPLAAETTRQQPNKATKADVIQPSTPAPTVDVEPQIDQEQLNIDLYYAARSGNVKKILQFLEDGADVNFTYSWAKETPLHLAASGNNTEAVKVLLQHGADPNIKLESIHTQTPLIYAVKNKNVTMTKLLLEHGADPDVNERNDEYPPLVRAAFDNNIEIVKLLLSHGAEVDIGGHGGNTALMEAGSNIELVKLLLDAGASPTLKDAYGHSAYYNATLIYRDNKELRQLFEQYIPEEEWIRY